MIRVHAVHGFASASFLIIASRIITEHAILGLSLVHILILAVFFIGIAIGSSMYKRITGGMVNGYLLMASLEILTGFIILFSFLLFTITAPAMQAIAGNADNWGRSAAMPAGCHQLLYSASGHDYRYFAAPVRQNLSAPYSAFGTQHR